MAASASPMANQLRRSFSSTSTARCLAVPKGTSASPFGVSPAKRTSSFTVRSVKSDKPTFEVVQPINGDPFKSTPQVFKIEKKWNNVSHSLNLVTKTHLSFTLSDLIISSPVLASESTASLPESSSGKIDLEAILISIDDFINRYPFFVAGCTFIYLVVIPLVQFYLSKRKPISAINAFRKLKNQPESQLLDIREEKTLALLASPNLKLMGKTSVWIPFNQEEELGFLEKVKNSFSNPENTVVCILDKLVSMETPQK